MCNTLQGYREAPETPKYNPSIGVIQTIIQKKPTHYFHGLQLAGPPARVRETFELNQLKFALQWPMALDFLLIKFSSKKVSNKNQTRPARTTESTMELAPASRRRARRPTTEV
jgi:hypothetical protein